MLKDQKTLPLDEEKTRADRLDLSSNSEPGKAGELAVRPLVLATGNIWQLQALSRFMPRRVLLLVLSLAGSKSANQSGWRAWCPCASALLLLA